MTDQEHNSNGGCLDEELRSLEVSPQNPPALLSLKEMEREHILYVLGRVNGNKKKAVGILGISLRCLLYKLSAYKKQGYLAPGYAGLERAHEASGMDSNLGIAQSRAPIGVVGQTDLSDIVTEHSHSDALDLKQSGRRAAMEAEKKVILDVLEQVSWNKSEASRRINISYKSLLMKIKQYGISS